MDNSVDNIIEICDKLKALLSDNGAFTIDGMQLLALLQKESLSIGDEEREDGERITPEDEKRGVYFRTVRGNRIAFEIKSGEPVGGNMRALGRESPMLKKLKNALKTAPDSILLYSNCGDRNEKGEVESNSNEAARKKAEKDGRMTLDMVLESNGMDFDQMTKDAPEMIVTMSRILAELASGHVKVYARMPLRKGNFFEGVELPALKKNNKVMKVTVIDVDTGEERELFRR